MNKKQAKYIMSILLVINLVLINGINGTALEKDEYKNLWYQYEDYPTDISDELSLTELVDVYNPPSDLLNEFSSEKLAELLMNYPLLWLFTTYEADMMDAIFFEFMNNNCDVYNELLRRNDGINCLIDMYRNSGFEPDLVSENPYIVWENNQSVVAEIFCCHFVCNMYWKFSEEEKLLCNEIINEKQEIYIGLCEGIPQNYFAFDIKSSYENEKMNNPKTNDAKETKEVNEVEEVFEENDSDVIYSNPKNDESVECEESIITDKKHDETNLLSMIVIFGACLVVFGIFVEFVIKQKKR